MAGAESAPWHLLIICRSPVHTSTRPSGRCDCVVVAPGSLSLSVSVHVFHLLLLLLSIFLPVLSHTHSNLSFILTSLSSLLLADRIPTCECVTAASYYSPFSFPPSVSDWRLFSFLLVNWLRWFTVKDLSLMIINVVFLFSFFFKIKLFS